jgi:hypothetical protein
MRKGRVSAQHIENSSFYFHPFFHGLTCGPIATKCVKPELRATQRFDDRESPYRVPKGGVKQAVSRPI